MSTPSSQDGARVLPYPAETPGQPLPGGARLVVIIPALNEERTIGDVIRRIPAQMPGVGEVRVVVVDDGSSDRTGPIAAALGARLVRHARPSGVGSAFRAGLREAIEMGADLVVNIDGDGQFRPEDIPRLIEPILDGRADFTTASRFADPSLVPQMPAIKRWGNRQVSRLTSLLAGARFDDVSCGMRAYGRRAALNLSLVGSFTYTHEVILNLSFKKMKLLEVPLAVRGERQFGRSRVVRSLARYAVNAARIILCTYRDYYPLRLFGGLAAVFTTLAVLSGGFLLGHYLHSGFLSPHKWAGFVSGFCLLLGLLSLGLAVIGDMLNRHRAYLEEILYYLRSASAGRQTLPGGTAESAGPASSPAAPAGERLARSA